MRQPIIMTKVLSIEPFRKESSQVKVELSSGDVYIIGFMGLQPVNNKEIYTRSLEKILEDFEASESRDLNSYLSYRLACDKLQTPLYVTPDRNGERERIGKKIREIRTSLNMEAKTLARLSQIDPANVTRIEQGKYSVGLDILCKIAMALDSYVDIIPNIINNDKTSNYSLTRKLWVIPTGEIDYNPICAVPGCGFCMWPCDYDTPLNIGDLVVFYNTKQNCYYEPFTVSGVEVKMKDIGEAVEFANCWPTSNRDCYIKADVNLRMSSGDKIRIKELAERTFKEAPTVIVEVKL